jgi:hypothetical protein
MPIPLNLDRMSHLVARYYSDIFPNIDAAVTQPHWRRLVRALRSPVEDTVSETEIFRELQRRVPSACISPPA